MFNLELEKQNAQSLFFKAITIVFFIRLTLAIWVPITGDEAYFIIWGKNLDYGYYDHTPMVGWLLALFLLISDATWWLRLPSVLLPIILSYLMFRTLQPRHPQVSVWVALVYLVAPVNIINFLITTDTPLIFFSFISTMYFYRAIYETESKQNFILSGLFLGLAFFSKYFAVFLGISYGIYIILFHRNRKGLIGLGLILLMVVPFVLLNLLWNYNHCWNNILFNVFNRTQGFNDPVVSLMKYAAILLYLFSPVMIYFVFKNRADFKKQRSDYFTHTYLWLIAVPLILFLLLTIKKEVGLHWLFSFYPFAFIAIAGLLSVKQWRWTFHFMWLFSLLHIIAVVSVMTLPVETFINKKEAVQNLVFGKYPQEVLENLKPYEDDYTFATISYGISSVASYHARRKFIVFDKASFHAREDERLTNYKELNGKNILIFKRTSSNLDKLSKYFSSSERKTFKVREATFELLVGNKFNYELYREEILKEINNEFYAIPDWLPVGQCEFKNKYGFN
jgi:4-amino-4-deoxy-L-arabinose transferase-like glycosyltransferase